MTANYKKIGNSDEEEMASFDTVYYEEIKVEFAYLCKRDICKTNEIIRPDNKITLEDVLQMIDELKNDVAPGISKISNSYI